MPRAEREQAFDRAEARLKLPLGGLEQKFRRDWRAMHSVPPSHDPSGARIVYAF